jgi:hypothetical protein
MRVRPHVAGGQVAEPSPDLVMRNCPVGGDVRLPFADLYFDLVCFNLMSPIPGRVSARRSHRLHGPMVASFSESAAV